jgi:hypothetical protein
MEDVTVVRSRSRYLAALAAIAFGIMISPGRARAETSGLPSEYFQLKNISNEPGRTPITIESVGALVLPPGSIVPNDPNQSPLEILAGSSGFDKDSLQVLLGEGTRDGQPAQALGLDFGAGGFQPGAILNFSLDISPLNTKITLTPELVDPEAGRSSIVLQAVSAQTVPEPGSIAVWTVGALAAGWYARGRAARRA